MKKTLPAIALLFSFSAIAATPQFTDISKDDVEDISKEFGGNFAHTAVAAPETDGVWGLEVGVIGGKTKSPNFSDVIEASGGKGDDFTSLYHAGLMARAHFPFDFFAEVTYLPEQEISDVKIKSNSIGMGWNLGSFLTLPLDIAVGVEYGRGNVKFHQDADLGATIPVPASDIELETKTLVYWAGVSKTFSFFTPYAKIGVSKIEGDLDATGQIFGYTSSTSESVESSGGFLAVGANLQFFIVKLGVEGSQIQDVRRFSGKLSFDF